MKLSETWFIEGYIDYELQKYRLLAYLQQVKESFNQSKLFPPLTEVIRHYNTLINFRKSKQLIVDAFPKTVDRIDIDKLQLVYEKLLTDDAVMQEINDITAYAEQLMKHTIEDGRVIYDHVEQQMIIEPIGILPIYKDEGYLFLRIGKTSEVRIYNYTITLFEHADDRYRGIKLEYIDTRMVTLVNTLNSLKIDIVRAHKKLPNPAVYKVDVPVVLPEKETILPITKMAVMKYIAHHPEG